MRLNRLTARKVQTAQAGAHGDGGGLWLVVTNTSRSWVFRWMRDGKAHAMGLGGYPTVTLEQARHKAAEARKALDGGISPRQDKNAPTVPSFEQAAKILHGQLSAGWKGKHGGEWLASLERYAFGRIGSLALDKITPKDMADMLRPIWSSKEETARRVKQRAHAIMAWAWAHGYIESNPVDVVGYLLPKQTDVVNNMPAMAWRNIPEWKSKHLLTGRVSALALEFLILTACRSGEVRGAVWAEFDFAANVWTIPADRMKAKIAHAVPLSDRALEILELQKNQHETLVFPSPRGKQLTDMALTQFLCKHKAGSDTAGRCATAHGFRSSFRDWASENGYARDLAERALAHVVANKVEAAYHRTNLLEQRRPMMQAWCDMVQGRELGEKVLAFRQK